MASLDFFAGAGANGDIVCHRFRTLKIAAGGVAAEVEVRQMVSEKFETVWLYRRWR